MTVCVPLPLFTTLASAFLPSAPFAPAAPVSPFAPAAPVSPFAPVAPSLTIVVVVLPLPSTTVNVCVPLPLFVTDASAFLPSLTTVEVV